MRTSSLALILLLLAGLAPLSAQPLTSLDGWNIFLDPGHSRTENMGVYGYSEAEKNLEVSLALKELLVEQTDIDTVYLSRDNHEVEVSLSQRVDYANRVAAAHFHSVHSNAAAPSANFALLLWPQWPDGSEAEPNGGKRMSELMVDLLSAGMRIPSRGAIGECDFYDTPCSDSNTGKGGSRNFVQKYTAMASELSEAGFHTNPRQNQLNMNADWKRLEAQTFFWAILDYHDVERPPVRIATGTVRDVESGEPINGATVRLADTSYTTDTYESLFYQYSNDPDQLRNGFYYLDELPAGTHQVVTEAEGYITNESQVTIEEDFFTFHDVELISTVPPTIVESTPSDGDSVNVLTDVEITFSRPMDRAAVEAALAFTPTVEGSLAWTKGDRAFVFEPDSLQPHTEYTLTIGPDAASPYGYTLDGDGDGTVGDAFALTFRTGPRDGVPPAPFDAHPLPNQRAIELHPIISVEFDERLDTTSITSAHFTLRPTSGGTTIDGALTHHSVENRTAVSFFPAQPLEPSTTYTFTLHEGIRDVVGNPTDSERIITFTTGSAVLEVNAIDDFESDLAARWWAPQQSGSTTGIVTESTARSASGEHVNLLTGSTMAMRLDYGWDVDDAPWLIRVFDNDSRSNASPSFDDSWMLQAYILGDGSGNLFRFAVDDQGAGGHEVSPWVEVDWVGWRLVSWDLSEDATGTWIGNGTLEAPLRFDSFQLSYAPDSPEVGQFYVDDLRLARSTTGSDAEDEQSVPSQVTLQGNYPNPFRTSTTLSFSLPQPTPVTLHVYDPLGRLVATLAEDRTFAPGMHTLTWDAAELPSGVYVARLHAGEAVETVRMVRVR